MPKTPKINVITGKLTCHIAVDRSDRESVDKVYEIFDRMCDDASLVGQASIETRLNRVPAPKPAPEASEPALDPGPTEPAADGLDIPERLRRAPKPEPAAAE